MKQILCIPLLLLLLCLPASAASQRVTATVTLTNTPVFPNTIVVNGNTRTWTNATAGSPSSLVLLGADRLISATNLANQIFATPYAGPIIASFTYGSNIVLVGQVDEAMAVSFSGTYARVAYATTSISSADYTVRIPVEGEPLLAQRTNVASDLAKVMSLRSSNAFNQNSVLVGELLGTTNAQTISANKTWTGTNQFTNSIWLGGSIVAPALTLATGQLTNVTVLYVFITNGYATGLNLGYLTNGNATNLILRSPITTNSVNYGNAISSPGIGVNSEQFGHNAKATNSSSLAVGYATQAYGDTSTALGNSASVDDTSANSMAIGVSAGITRSESAIGIGLISLVVDSPNAIAIGNQSFVQLGTNSIAIGYGANVYNYNSSVAIGVGAASTAANQILLGGSGIDTYVQNVLQVAGAVTNTTFTGTNVWKGSLAFKSTSNAILANGDNVPFPLGTNVLIRLSGASTIANLQGFNAAPDGEYHIIKITGSITNRIYNELGGAPAAQRINTGTGSDLISTNNPTWLTVVYDITSARWNVISIR